MKNFPLYEKLSEKGEKSPAYVLRVCENPLLLHPLSETKAALLERLASLIRKTFGRFSGPPFAREVRGRKKRRKKLPEKFGSYLKNSLSLQPLS